MFGIDILDASGLAAAGVALGGGVISFLSPCVLPIVPPYLAFMAGSSLDGLAGRAVPRGRAVLAAAFFVLGLSTVFVLMGAAASALGQAILAWQDWLARIAGLVVMLFGLHFLGIVRIPLLYREARLSAGDGGGGVAGAYVLGLAFAFGWTPCIGPVLGAILGLAAQGDGWRGVGLLAAYAMGLGIPFLIAALFIGPFLRFAQRFRRHLDRVERVMGVFLWTVGLLMLTGGFAQMSYWLLETFPGLAAFG
ncbi:MAG: cytochrome C biogenesis protein CcdA [Paracoccaceae bacterium]|nr:MAG: cytochrome c biogenesis protein CcdA [Alphaproteobacteria bacterium]GIX15080.1 MAG: cytochrome C biogenesis protein CcdA [Paracoccaceae bacterium]